MSMFKNVLFGFILLGYCSFSSAALCVNATVTQGGGPNAEVFSFGLVNGNQFISPNPAATCQLDGVNPDNQNANTIATLMEAAFELGANSLNFLQAGEGFAGDEAVGIDSINISGLTAFNYLAIHYGRGELFFAFSNPITEFTLTGLPRGLSNYRTYSDGLSEIPLPAAGWLFGFVLIGLMGLRRKMN